MYNVLQCNIFQHKHYKKIFCPLQPSVCTTFQLINFTIMRYIATKLVLLFYLLIILSATHTTKSKKLVVKEQFNTSYFLLWVKNSQQEFLRWFALSFYLVFDAGIFRWHIDVKNVDTVRDTLICKTVAVREHYHNITIIL